VCFSTLSVSAWDLQSQAIGGDNLHQQKIQPPTIVAGSGLQAAVTHPVSVTRLSLS
jgi:hypothetical protein